MKTAERILVTALELLNQHGEGNVSSVDIAMEMDISPGNLYYHFKGKEVIVQALFELYRDQMDRVLRAATEKDLSVEEFFYMLYLMMEQGQLFQFLFHNPAELIDKYPALSKPFRQQLTRQEHCIHQLLKDFARQKQLQASDGQLLQIVELIGLVFTQSASYYAIKAQPVQGESFLYRCLASVLFAVLPYINLEKGELHHLQDAIATQSLAATLSASA